MSDSPRLASTATDMELLRCFEPVMVFTRGEQFYPFDVERYLKNCSLWEHTSAGQTKLLVNENQLTIEKLVEPRRGDFGTFQFLRFVEPLSLSETALALADTVRLRRRKGTRFPFGQGRLARGGFLPRIVDALFSVSLLLRGRVPGATAIAAELYYQ